MVTIKDFGPIDSIYFAYSADDDIRFRASSGGFVKSLLVYLLESRSVDSVVITRTGSPESPLVPETIITDIRAEIISSRTNSVYMVNYPLQVLHRIDPSKKYAFVGLPCHIRNLKAMQKNGKYKNIIFVISLFCHHTPNIEFTTEILKKLDVKEQDLAQIEYRGNGWPGGFTAHLKNGQNKFISGYWSSDLDNGPAMCKYCSEIGRDADIYAGDPWNLELEKTDNKGTTLVICRNSEASALVIKSVEKGYIKADKCNPKVLLRSQGHHIKDKINRGSGKTTRNKPGKISVRSKQLVNLIIHPVAGYHVGMNILRALLNRFKNSN